MDYEKKYKEALERARTSLTNEVAADIFPELKESEDDKIRKELLNAFIESTDSIYMLLTPLKREAFIAWLEKQGEQKLNVNDNAKEMFIKALERVEEQNAKGYKLTDCDKISWWEDFKAYTTSKQILANSAKKCKDEQKPTEWSEEDEKTIVKMRDFFIKVLGDKPDFTEDKRYEEFIEFIDNRLKSLRPQKPIEWTMQDEEELQIALDTLVKAGQHSSAKWLKNVCLVPQSHWEPSDEQIKVCKEVYADILSAKGFDLGNINSELNRLEEELKKLKG